MHCFDTVHALFMDPTVTLFKKNIKNESHGIIHTFKNYFITVFQFLIFNFQFQQKYVVSKWNLNTLSTPQEVLLV